MRKSYNFFAKLIRKSLECHWKSWKSHEKFMKKSWNSNDKVIRKSRKKHERVMRISWESHNNFWKNNEKVKKSHKKGMRYSWENHKRAMSKSWQCHEKVMKELWESHEKIMRNSCRLCRHVCSCLFSAMVSQLVTRLMGGDNIMACHYGKGHCKKVKYVNKIHKRRCQMVPGRCQILSVWCTMLL